MPADWEEAIRIAGRGFAVTILVLLILAMITWLVGLVIRKAAARGEKGGDTDKGDV